MSFAASLRDFLVDAYVEAAGDKSRIDFPIGPQDTISRLSAEMQKIVQTKSVTDLLITQGADAIASTAVEFRDRNHADIVKWTATIKAAGVRPE